jgi:hypothetical protein
MSEREGKHKAESLRARLDEDAQIRKQVQSWWPGKQVTAREVKRWWKALPTDIRQAFRAAHAEGTLVARLDELLRLGAGP